MFWVKSRTILCLALVKTMNALMLYCSYTLTRRLGIDGKQLSMQHLHESCNFFLFFLITIYYKGVLD